VLLKFQILRHLTPRLWSCSSRRFERW